MPRSHRRREERPREDSLDRLIAGWKRVETRGAAQWYVQPLSAAQAQKEYVCPGCSGVIPAGTPNFGDAFCAAVLYGLHAGWSARETAEMAHRVAASSLSGKTATDGIPSMADLLAQKE